MPATNLARGAAQLVHPDLAFLIRHIGLPGRVDEIFTGTDADRLDAYVSTAKWQRKEGIPEDIEDYILRVHGAVETLFGPIDFDMHSYRTYTKDGLPFHSDPEDVLAIADDDEDLSAMVTCVHNATDEDRHLTFCRETWTQHTESFRLALPAKTMLAFGQSLIFDYQHGIPPAPEAASYRSVVTRFAKWDTKDE